MVVVYLVVNLVSKTICKRYGVCTWGWREKYFLCDHMLTLLLQTLHEFSPYIASSFVSFIMSLAQALHRLLIKAAAPVNFSSFVREAFSGELQVRLWFVICWCMFLYQNLACTGKLIFKGLYHIVWRTNSLFESQKCRMTCCFHAS